MNDLSPNLSLEKQFFSIAFQNWFQETTWKKSVILLTVPYLCIISMHLQLLFQSEKVPKLIILTAITSGNKFLEERRDLPWPLDNPLVFLLFSGTLFLTSLIFLYHSIKSHPFDPRSPYESVKNWRTLDSVKNKNKEKYIYSLGSKAVHFLSGIIAIYIYLFTMISIGLTLIGTFKVSKPMLFVTVALLLIAIGVTIIVSNITGIAMYNLFTTLGLVITATFIGNAFGIFAIISISTMWIIDVLKTPFNLESEKEWKAMILYKHLTVIMNHKHLTYKEALMDLWRNILLTTDDVLHHFNVTTRASYSTILALEPTIINEAARRLLKNKISLLLDEFVSFLMPWNLKEPNERLVKTVNDNLDLRSLDAICIERRIYSLKMIKAQLEELLDKEGIISLRQLASKWKMDPSSLLQVIPVLLKRTRIKCVVIGNNLLLEPKFRRYINETLKQEPFIDFRTMNIEHPIEPLITVMDQWIKRKKINSFRVDHILFSRHHVETLVKENFQKNGILTTVSILKALNLDSIAPKKMARALEQFMNDKKIAFTTIDTVFILNSRLQQFINQEINKNGFFNLGSLEESIIDDKIDRKRLLKIIDEWISRGKIKARRIDIILTTLSERTIVQSIQAAAIEWQKMRQRFEDPQYKSINKNDLEAIHALRTKLTVLEEACKILNNDLLLQGILSLKTEIHVTLGKMLIK